MQQHPYSRYPAEYQYQPQEYQPEYNSEYQQGYYAPEPHQGQGPPSANPFLAPPGPKRAPPRRSRKKRTTPAQPVVPQPGTTTTPARPATQADEKLEWVLVPKGTPAPSLSNPAETPALEPEPVKVNAKLVEAQAEVDRVQWLVESSLCILVEPRRVYPIEKFGTLEAYLPSEKIEVITAITTLTSIFLSGYRFFQLVGLPDKTENRLLGRVKQAYFKENGILSGFMNLTHLTPADQNLKLASYEAELQGVVRGFLTQFAGHQTLYRTPAIMFKIGAPLTILHKHLLRRSAPVPGFMKECKESFHIFDSMNAMSARETTDIAEIALQHYDDIKGPLENRITVLKALGVHLRDLTSAAAYLVTASDPIPLPTILDLENWAGINSNEAQTELLGDIQSCVVTNQINIEKMAVILRALLKKMHQADTLQLCPPHKAIAAPEQTVPAGKNGTSELPSEDDLISSDEDQD